MKKSFEIKHVNETAFQVVYYPEESEGFQLPYLFTSREQASACILFVEAWLQHGGKVCVENKPEGGLVTGFDGSELCELNLTSVELMRCIVTQGLCPKPIASYLMGVDESHLQPYLLDDELGLELVDMAQLIKTLATKRALAALEQVVEQQEVLDKVENLEQRMMLHHRSLMMDRLMDSAIADETQRAMFRQYLHGYPLNVIGDQYKVSYLQVRKQVNEARKLFEAYMLELLTAKDQLKSLSAELLQVKEELDALKRSFIVRELQKQMPDPDPSFYEWANFTLKNLFVSLDNYPFSVRATRSLESLGVKRVDQLLALDLQKLKSLPNIGEKTCSELEEFIRDHQLDALRNPAVLSVVRSLADKQLQAACDELGVCKVVKTTDGFILYDEFGSEEQLDKVLEKLYEHPSVLRDPVLI